MNTRLSESEKEIMEVLVQVGKPITSRELLEYFNRHGKNWKKQTLNTFLIRMREKGKLSVSKAGEKNVYIAHMTNLDTIPKANDADSITELIFKTMFFCKNLCEKKEKCKEYNHAKCKKEIKNWLLKETLSS